jgi:predicted 3-demethylubiquinone-9 3-methyltransferase (glyoxalase superfamily)
MPTVTPFLWFDHRLEEAVTFYTTLFADGRVIHTSRYGPGGPQPAGTVMSMTFEIAGQRVMALNGGPMYTHTPAFSLFVSCRTQEEVDHYWSQLVEGGRPSQCGWLVDRYGLSWQVIPEALGRLLGDPDRARAGRAMQAMLQMQKIDVAALERAAAGA